MSLIAFAAVGGAAFVLNVGAGWFRAGSRKLSFQWMLYIHLPILAVAPLRRWFDLELWTVPLLIGLSVAGQIFGGRLSRSN